MTTIHVQMQGDQAVLPKSELERLLELARRAEPVRLHVGGEELTLDMARLAATGGAFDFWSDTGEDIYSMEDGEPL